MNPRYRYSRGEWYAVLAPGAAVLLPPGEHARAARCWQLLEEGAAPEAVLDALLADGVSSLSDLVVVEAGEDGVRVLVRGEPQVETGAESLDGTGVRTWRERVLPAGSAVAVRLPGAPDPGGAGDSGEHRELEAGLVRVSALLLGGEPAAVREAEPEPVPEPEPEPEPAPVPEPDDTWADHDGLTRSGRPDPDLLPGPPGIPGQPQPPGVLARPVARLVFSSGEMVDVDRAVVVGRAPEARQFRATDQPRLVTVPSPQQEISSTHLEIRPGAGVDHGSATVTDLGSTNGTVLLQPGLAPEELQAGIAVALLPGAIVDLGDGVTIQVARA